VQLKRADDKSKRLALLEDLQHSPRLDARQKRWLREELVRTRKGIQGESESAYFLDQYFKDGENHVVLHDLRFIVDGDVAQIDHLIFNRIVGVYLIETKNYAGNVVINEHGEFMVDYDGERYGVASPIEQSHRHARILQRLFETLEIKGRTGAPLEFHHVVMFHPKAIITRPAKAAVDISNVIKADQFPTWHSQFAEKSSGVANLFRLAVNLRSLDTLKEWGEKLKRQHRPANLLELPDFMKAGPAAQPVQAPAAPPPAPSIAPIKVKAAAPAVNSVTSESNAKRLVCLHCSSKISYPEGKYCWNNSVRFKGGQYCREHQALF
jgi:hypothetical protein